jgi:hypothetical protein
MRLSRRVNKKWREGPEMAFPGETIGQGSLVDLEIRDAQPHELSAARRLQGRVTHAKSILPFHSGQEESQAQLPHGS